MSETPKEKPTCSPDNAEDLEKEDSWEADQNKRNYYYDDAYGYEKFEPDAVDGDELETDKGPPDE